MFQDQERIQMPLWQKLSVGPGSKDALGLSALHLPIPNLPRPSYASHPPNPVHASGEAPLPARCESPPGPGGPIFPESDEHVSPRHAGHGRHTLRRQQGHQGRPGERWQQTD